VCFSNDCKIPFTPLVALLLAVFLLVGCVPVPVAGWTPVFVGGPTGFDLPDYSLGPVSSDRFADLIATAMPVEEGEVLLFGRVELAFRKDFHGHLFSAVAVMSDTGILLLKWYEPEDRYRIVARLSYSDIQEIAINTLGLGAAIHMCLAIKEFVLADESHAIDPMVSMTFIRPSGFIQDTDRSEAAFAVLQEKIHPTDGGCVKSAETMDAGTQANLGDSLNSY